MSHRGVQKSSPSLSNQVRIRFRYPRLNYEGVIEIDDDDDDDGEGEGEDDEFDCRYEVIWVNSWIP